MSAKAADYLKYIRVLGVAPALLFVNLLSTVSDKHGRKLAILLPMLGFMAYTFLNVVVVHYALPLWLFNVAAVAQGLTGGYTVFLAGLFMSAMDLSTPATQTLRIGIMEGMVFVGQCLGGLGECVRAWERRCVYVRGGGT